ncbi:MAG TPA: ABC transporter permease [Vicinamibacterales bacterium]|nr:ABC transporter permease [Vicinamibacterales bacterium]
MSATVRPDWLARVFRALLICFPPPFRQRFGASMLATFGEGLDRRRGVSRLRFAARAFAGMITSGIAERLAARRADPSRLAAALEYGRDLVRDGRRTVRLLWRERAVSTLSIVTLAVGLGASASVYSLVDAALLRPIALPDADRLVAIHTVVDDAAGLSSFEDVRDWQARSRAFAALGAVRSQTVNLTGLEMPSALRGGFVVGDLFGVAGIAAELGRTLTGADLEPASAPVAVITDAVWRDQFQYAPDVIGRSVQLNNIAFTIVGVLPPAFVFPYDRIDVWMSARFHTGAMSRQTRTVAAFARLRPSATVEQAGAELRAVAAQLSAEHPATNRTRAVRLTPMHEWLTADVRGRLTLLFAFVIVLMIAACANVTSLQLGAIARRRAEIGVRVALGASRARLVRELLAEQFVIAGAAAAVATILTFVLVPIAVERALAVPGLRVAGLDRVVVNGRVAAFIGVLACAAALASGLAPIWRWTRRVPVSTLGAGARTSDARVTHTRMWLVASQVAIAAILTTTGGLIVASYLKMASVDPGFDPAGIWSLEYRLPANKYREPARQAAFHEAVVAAVAALPGVRHAAVVRAMPFSGNSDLVEIASDVDAPGTPARTVGFNTVSDDYFATMGVPLIEGRTFDVRDRAEAPVVVVINRTAAARLFGSTSAIGRAVLARGSGVRAEVVGVVGDVRHERLAEDPLPAIYARNAQNPGIFMTLVARADAGAASIGEAMRRAVWSLDADQPVWKMRTLSSLVDADTSGTRFMFAALVVFSLAAVVLVASGLYGVMSEGVHDRRRELGLRVALGANRRAVLGDAMRSGLAPAFAGLAAGVAGSIALSFWLQNMLYRTPPLTIAPYLVTVLLLAAIVVASCYVPARRAAGVDPARALRE